MNEADSISLYCLQPLHKEMLLQNCVTVLHLCDSIHALVGK